MTGSTSATTNTLVAEVLRARPSRLQSLLRVARSKPLGTVSALIILFLIFMAITADWIAPYSPFEFQPQARLAEPRARFWFGADMLGRDLLSRIIHGSRVSLWVGLMSVGIGTVGGAVLGLLSGFFEGTVDMVIQRLMDAIMAFPPIILALALVSVLGPSITNVMIAIGLVIAPSDSRVVRGAVLSVKQNQYIEAARCIGASNWRILFRHIFPNVVAPILIIASVWLGNAIIIEASMSFLGLGTPPPTPSWGGMLSGEGRRQLERAPWLAIFPGLAISVVVLAFNLLGDALRDVLDPRLRGT